MNMDVHVEAKITHRHIVIQRAKRYLDTTIIAFIKTTSNIHPSYTLGKQLQIIESVLQNVLRDARVGFAWSVRQRQPLPRRVPIFGNTVHPAQLKCDELEGQAYHPRFPQHLTRRGE